MKQKKRNKRNINTEETCKNFGVIVQYCNNWLYRMRSTIMFPKIISLVICMHFSSLLVKAETSDTCTNNGLGCILASQQRTILSLKEDIDNLTCKRNIDMRENLHMKFSQEIKENYAEIKESIKEMKDILIAEGQNKMAADLAVLQQEVVQLKEELEKGRRIRQEIQEKSRIAFTACAGSTRNYSPFERIPFEIDIFNYGEHYNPQNSSFVCPYNGIYQFELNLLSNSGRCLRARVMKNSFSGVINDGFAEIWTCDKGSHHQASNSVFLECRPGDVIWVANAYEGNGMYGNALHDRNRCISSFSGRFIADL